METRFKNLQAWLCRKTGTKQALMSHVMTGKRRPSPELAVLLEPLLLQKGINLTRMDLIFGYKKGQSWQQLLKNKERDEK